MSSVASVTYPLAKFLTKILHPLVGKNGYHIHNVRDYADKVVGLHLEEYETMMSFDVTALFTSVPV